MRFHSHVLEPHVPERSIGRMLIAASADVLYLLVRQDHPLNFTQMNFGLKQFVEWMVPGPVRLLYYAVLQLAQKVDPADLVHGNTADLRQVYDNRLQIMTRISRRAFVVRNNNGVLGAPEDQSTALLRARRHDILETASAEAVLKYRMKHVSGGICVSRRFTLALCAAVFWFSLYLYIPYLTPHLLAMGISASLTGLIVAAHAFVQMIARFPMGIAASRRGTHKRTIVTGMAMSAVSAAVMYWYPSAAMLCVGNALSGYASAAYIGFTVVYGKYYSPQQSDRAMGMLSAIVESGILAAFVLGGFLDAAGGIRLIFLTACLSGAAGLVLSLFVKDVKLPKTPETISDVRKVVTNRMLILSSVLCILLKVIVFGTAFGFTPKLARDIGAQGIELGLINAIFIAASVLSSFLITTNLGRRIGDVHLSALGFVFLCTYCVSITFVRSIPLFMMMQFVGGLGYASLTAIFMSNATRSLPDAQKPAGQGLYQALDSLGSTLGPIMIGVIAGLLSYTAAFLASAAVAAAGIALSLYGGKRHLMPGGIGSSV